MSLCPSLLYVTLATMLLISLVCLMFHNHNYLKSSCHSGKAMAAVMSCSGRVLPYGRSSEATTGLTPSSPFKRRLPFEQNKIKIQQLGIHTKERAENKLFKDNRLRWVLSSASNSGFKTSPPSPSGTIMQFYTCINEKNLKQLREFISDDCYFDDFSFPKPFQGKKEVMHFLEQLIGSMGKNVKFCIGYICEGDEFTAGVDWHLEWKKTEIPFTRGCSFYECSKGGERLIIRKARIVIESPIKPGGLVLALLKIVTSLFDDFPDAAEWFLKSFHVILRWLINIYTMVLQYFIKPLLASYINIWNFTAQLLGCTLRILLHISKIFFK